MLLGVAREAAATPTMQALLSDVDPPRHLFHSIDAKVTTAAITGRRTEASMQLPYVHSRMSTKLLRASTVAAHRVSPRWDD